MLILAVTLWLGASATAHAQVSSSVGTQPNLQVSAQTGAQVKLADQCGVHGDRRNRAVRPGSDRRNGRKFQYRYVRGGTLSIRCIAERQSNGVRLRVRSARRPHLSDSGGGRGYRRDNGTSRRHRRQCANCRAQRPVGRWSCRRRCLTERELPGRDTVNGRQCRRRRPPWRHRRMLSAFL
jgi:hypothetical protein